MGKYLTLAGKQEQNMEKHEIHIAIGILKSLPQAIKNTN